MKIHLFDRSFWLSPYGLDGGRLVVVKEVNRFAAPQILVSVAPTREKYLSPAWKICFSRFGRQWAKKAFPDLFQINIDTLHILLYRNYQ